MILAAQENRRPVLRIVLLMAIALLAIVPGIFEMPPVDRDEARFVQASKQMVESGDYVDIRFQTESRYKKPVGIYWLQTAAVNLSGQGADAPIWVYRLVSVLGILFAVFSTYWTGKNLFGEKAGFVSAVVVAGIFGSAFEGRIGKTDAMLLGVSILAQGALAQIYVAARNRDTPAKHLPWIFWAAQGAGILLKGPITPLLSLLTIVCLSVWDRDWRWLAKLRPARGVLLTLLIVLPWLVLITLKSGGAFWQESVGKDLVGKLGQGAESHWGPPGYYVITYSLYFWPFGLLAIGAGILALRSARLDARLRFCLAWYIPFWLVIEAVSTKLPHYVLPAYPGLILLIGWVSSLTREEASPMLRLWEKLLWFATAFGLVVVSLGLAAAVIAAPIYLQGGLSWWSIPAALLLILAGGLALSKEIRVSQERIAAVTIAAAAAYALMFGVVFPSIGQMWLSPRIAAAVEQHKPCPTTQLASAGFHEPSLIFLVGTHTLLTDGAGAAAQLAADPACALALVSAGEEAGFKTALEADGHAASSVATVDGLNYSSGDALVLTLYVVRN